MLSILKGTLKNGDNLVLAVGEYADELADVAKGMAKSSDELADVAKGMAESSDELAENVAKGLDEGVGSTPKGLIGKEFEDFLAKELDGDGSFKVGGREFDGAVGNRWWEAKSGNYWKNVTSSDSGLAKFKSDMGDRLNIARQNGVTYELHSNSPIPQEIKDWLAKKGILFTEWK